MAVLAFDVDGTIFDSDSIIVDAFAGGIDDFMRRQPGARLDLPAKSDIIAQIGNPAGAIFSALFPGLDPESRSLMERLCTERLSAMVRSGGGRLVDGAAETLAALARDGHRLLVASNGRIEYLRSILETHGLWRLFERPVLCIDRASGRRDKTDIVREYVRLHSSGNGAFVMIGDRGSDMAAARGNGVAFIGCAFGHAGDAEISCARHIARRFGEIPAMVKIIEASFPTPRIMHCGLLE